MSEINLQDGYTTVRTDIIPLYQSIEYSKEFGSTLVKTRNISPPFGIPSLQLYKSVKSNMVQNGRNCGQFPSVPKEIIDIR